MTHNESDDETVIREEIRELELRLERPIEYTYKDAMDRKFARHRLADLYYILKNPGVVLT